MSQGNSHTLSFVTTFASRLLVVEPLVVLVPDVPTGRHVCRHATYACVGAGQREVVGKQAPPLVNPVGKWLSTGQKI